MAKVYKEENGSKPEYAREGDIVITGGGAYVVGADGSGKLVDKDTTTYNYKGGYDTAPAVTAPDPNSDLMSTTWKPQSTASDNLYKSAYARQLEANEASTRAAVQGYKSQIPGINSSYDELAKQEYINYMMGKKDLKEDLSTMGLGTQGVTESSLNQANSAYGYNLNQNELARQNALGSVKSSIAQVQAQGAQNNATIQGNLLQTLAGIAANRESQQQAYDINAQEAEKTRAYNLLVSGYYSDEIAAAAGYTPAEGKYIASRAQQQMAAKSAGSGSGTGQETYMNKDIALSMYSNGDRSPAVISSLEHYYGTTINNIANAYGLSAYGTTSNSAVDTSTYPAIREAMMSSGNAMKWYNENKQYMTDDEKRYAAALADELLK